MGSQAWSVRIEDESHRIEVEHGFWTQRVAVRVDGTVVLRGSRFFDMAYDRGIEVPLSLYGHAIVVGIRPVHWLKTFWVSDYRFGLTVDGMPIPGSPALPPLVPGVRRGIRSMSSLVEAIAWSGAGVAAGRLLVQGPAVGALLMLGAPLLCSLVLRRGTQLSLGLRLAIAIGVFVAWVAIAAMILRGLGLVPAGRFF
jgi:hypothetical protein